ncbi:MAG: hypothetical protein ACYC5Y_05035 [Symbiobacteriia bacterium]
MCEACGYRETVAQIKDMLDSGDYEWAEDTLEGILEWVERNRHVTDRQKEAVQNIVERGGR